MKCSPIRVAGEVAIVCGPKRIYACQVLVESIPELCLAPSGFQCDWKMPGGGRCDAHLCEEHRTNVGDDKDLCPIHAKAWETHQGNAQQCLAL